jgi:hypothetical protein
MAEPSRKKGKGHSKAKDDAATICKPFPFAFVFHAILWGVKMGFIYFLRAHEREKKKRDFTNAMN